MPGPTGSDRAVLDTCVLYPATLRALLLTSAEVGQFEPVWSDRILGELRGSLQRDGRLDGAGWRRLEHALETSFPDARVDAGRVDALEPTMANHPKDRHVLAAAAASDATVVVTTNLRDFPAAAARSVGVEIQHPDRFLTGLLQQHPREMGLVLSAQAQAMRTGSQRWSVPQLLGQLGGRGRAPAITPRFVANAERTLGLVAAAPPARGVTRGLGGPGRSQQRESGGREGRDR